MSFTFLICKASSDKHPFAADHRGDHDAAKRLFRHCVCSLSKPQSAVLDNRTVSYLAEERCPASLPADDRLFATHEPGPDFNLGRR